MCKLCMQFSQNRNFQASKQARKSELRKCKYIEKRVYRALKAVYLLVCRNISKVIKNWNSAFPFQLNLSHKKSFQ